MEIAKLLNHWQTQFGQELSEEKFSLSINSKDAARINALCELFPGMSREHILRDLISAALDDFSKNLPYVQGAKIVATDEDGFPLYEDIGLTPKFLSLTRKHSGES